MAFIDGFTPLGPFNPWYMGQTPVIPKFYWNIKSQEQRIKEICCRLSKLCDYASDLDANEELLRKELEALNKEFEQFKESGFDDYYAEQISQWVQNHMEGIIRDAILMVFFGLTDDGYFCAYIPSSWDDIEFDTGAVYGADDYGRLILDY